jgi:hypothetical protein
MRRRRNGQRHTRRRRARRANMMPIHFSKQRAVLREARRLAPASRSGSLEQYKNNVKREFQRKRVGFRRISDYDSESAGETALRMSTLLVQQYLNELADLKRVSGDRRESVVREAFKTLLKGWGRARVLHQARAGEYVPRLTPGLRFDAKETTVLAIKTGIFPRE